MAKAKKTPKKTTKRGPKREQARLDDQPGVEAGSFIEQHPDIEPLALVYVEKRDAHLELTKELTKAKKDLHAEMKKREVMRYPVGDDYEAIREPGEETVKVKKTEAAKARAKNKGISVTEGDVG
jgi:hypothetical protein